jgi:hypothetical protein
LLGGAVVAADNIPPPYRSFANDARVSVEWRNLSPGAMRARGVQTEKNQPNGYKKSSQPLRRVQKDSDERAHPLGICNLLAKKSGVAAEFEHGADGSPNRLEEHKPPTDRQPMSACPPHGELVAWARSCVPDHLFGAIQFGYRQQFQAFGLERTITGHTRAMSRWRDGWSRRSIRRQGQMSTDPSDEVIDRLSQS